MNTAGSLMIFSDLWAVCTLKKSKTIAFFCDVNIYSGHDIMSVNIANALSRRYDVSFLFCHPAYQQNLDKAVTRKYLVLHNNKTGLVNLLLKSWGDIFTIRKLLQAIKADVVIVCQGEYHLCLKGLISALMLRKHKVISYIPIGYPYSIIHSKSSAIATMIKFIVYRLIVRRFHAFITISVEQERMLRNFIKADRPVYLLENLTEFPAIKISRKKQKSIRYGIIGRIQKSKGQYKTIELAERVRQHRRDFMFVIFGEGDDEDWLKNSIAEKNLEDHFEFKGWVDSRKKIFSDIDVLLLLSEIEGVPLVFLESLFFKTPVLANRLTSNPIYERYIDGELIFNSVNDLANKMIDIERYLSIFKRKSKLYKKLIIERHGRKNFENNLFELFEKI